MHGLINRSIQCFLRDTYGPATWAAVAREAQLGLDGFEAMLSYETGLTETVVVAAAQVLMRPRETVLEDMGTYLVSHPNTESLRRLLRFGGVTFVDFLHSLEDLPGRARLALPDLELPGLELADTTTDTFRLRCRSPIAGAGHVVMGLLRAMADDYGALVLLEHLGEGPLGEVISIQVLDTGHAVAKRFDLAQRAG